ncbi:MAG: hypothetical protein NC120_10500 [Ruminococcus sp.]|nr:hypothetical protein [Ruminococcus sp.]
MDPVLEYCGNYIEIKDFRHNTEDEKAGNPYNCSFNIKIVSGLFSGFADGCEQYYKEMKKFAEQLEDLINFRIKRLTFTEIGYGNRIDFVCDRTGHIKVSGEIYGDTRSHCLKFEFMTDQTAFPSFINALKKL